MAIKGGNEAANEQGPRWPARLISLCRGLQSAGDGAARESLLGEAWVLLKAALLRYLRYHAAGFGQVTAEDIEDIASQKTFDLLRKAEIGEWDLSGRHPSEVKGFLSRVARNGLLNLLKKIQREPTSDPTLDSGRESAFGAAGAELHAPPEQLVECQEFVQALQRCVERLNERSRLIWFLRVCCEMSSKEIAKHPRVGGLQPSHVDVLMQRGRQKIKDCMEAGGFQPQDMPQGAFTVLWKTILLEMP
jgi:RNA polymerase sigma factor (sigma-70 family)